MTNPLNRTLYLRKSTPLFIPTPPSQSSTFLHLRTQTSFTPTGAAPVHPPSHVNTVLVCVSSYVVVAGKLAGQYVIVGAQLLMTLLLTTAVVERVVRVTCAAELVV